MLKSPQDPQHKSCLEPLKVARLTGGVSTLVGTRGAHVLIELSVTHRLPSSTWIKLTRLPISLPVRTSIGVPTPAR
jgi:hypothetical protein